MGFKVRKSAADTWIVDTFTREPGDELPRVHRRWFSSADEAYTCFGKNVATGIPAEISGPGCHQLVIMKGAL